MDSGREPGEIVRDQSPGKRADVKLPLNAHVEQSGPKCQCG